MPGIHHREPGPVVAALRDERVTLEIIADGVHVHPDVVALAFTQAPGRVALIAVADAAAGVAAGALAMLAVGLARRVRRTGLSLPR